MPSDRVMELLRGFTDEELRRIFICFNTVCDRGDLNAIRLLIALGVDVNRKYWNHGDETTAMLTTFQRNSENMDAIIEMLKEAGARADMGTLNWIYLNQNVEALEKIRDIIDWTTFTDLDVGVLYNLALRYKFAEGIAAIPEELRKLPQ